MLFHDLPDDVLLLLADPESGYMHWMSTIQLSLTSSRLRALIVPLLDSLTDEQWRVRLARCGFGRSRIHGSRSWSALARALVAHAEPCAVCGAILNEQMSAEVPKDPKAKVITRQQARSDGSLGVYRGISWDGHDMLDKFVSCHESFARNGAAGIVSMCAHSVHQERVRLSPYLACRYLSLNTAQGKLLEEDLAKRVRSTHTDAFWENPKFCLQAHIVLSSLLATTKPVAELVADQHNYCFFTEDPPRRDLDIAVTEPAVRNVAGLTTLDVMRFLSDWRGGTTGMHERELLPFAGIEWDTMEFIEGEDGTAMDVEMVARYERAYADEDEGEEVDDEDTA